MRTAVYRLYSSGDELLYIGRSVQPEVRLKFHQLDAAWGDAIDRMETEWFASATAADAAEREAIRTEEPAWNCVNNPAAPSSAKRRHKINVVVTDANKRDLAALSGLWGCSEAAAVRRLIDEGAEKHAAGMQVMREMQAQHRARREEGER